MTWKELLEEPTLKIAYVFTCLQKLRILLGQKNTVTEKDFERQWSTKKRVTTFEVVVVGMHSSWCDFTVRVRERVRFTSGQDFARTAGSGLSCNINLKILVFLIGDHELYVPVFNCQSQKVSH